eukprot:jgi/Bigna1/126519/aug1.2_g1227
MPECNCRLFLIAEELGKMRTPEGEGQAETLFGRWKNQGGPLEISDRRQQESKSLDEIGLHFPVSPRFNLQAETTPPSKEASVRFLLFLTADTLRLVFNVQ